MSLHDAADHAPAPAHGDAPAPGAWRERRERELAQRAREADGRRDAVRKRLQWASPGGRSLADLARGLGWPGGPTGVPAVLRELATLGEAHEREGVWYAGPGPASVGGDTPPVTGALGSAAAAATARDLADPRGAQGSAPTTGAPPVDEDSPAPELPGQGVATGPAVETGGPPSRGVALERRALIAKVVQERPGVTLAELHAAVSAAGLTCVRARIGQHVLELEELGHAHRRPSKGRGSPALVYPGPSTAPAVEPREGAVHPDGGDERGSPALPAEVSTSPDAHVEASVLHPEAGPPTGGVVAQPDAGASGGSLLAEGVAHHRPAPEGRRQLEHAAGTTAPATPPLPATSGVDETAPADPPPDPRGHSARSPEVDGSGIPEVRWTPYGAWRTESGWHDVATIPLRDVLVRWASGDVQRWVSLGPDDPDLATATGWRELPAERVATPPRPAPDPMYVAATLRQQLGEAEDRLVSAELDLAAERTELGEARADLALVDRVLDTLGVPQAGPRAFRLGWIAGRSEGR